MDTDQLIATLSEDAPVMRPVIGPWRLAVVWIVGVMVYASVFLMILGMRADIMTQWSVPLFALEIGLLLVMVISSGISASLLAFPDMHQKPGLARLPIVFFTMFIALVMYQFLTTYEGIALALHECWCTLYITIYAVIPAAVLFYLTRRAATTNPALTGSVVVLAGFSLGALILRLVEQTDSMAHLVIFHYAPMLAAGVMGLALGRRLLRW